MSTKNEKYANTKARKKHESKESSKEMTREYGAAKAKTKKVMKEWKAGTLHSGKKGPVVKSQKQAVAIALSEARKVRKKK